MKRVDQKQEPKNFDKLVMVEKLKFEIKVGKEKLSVSKTKRQIKKNLRVLKTKENKLNELKKELGAN